MSFAHVCAVSALSDFTVFSVTTFKLVSYTKNYSLISTATLLLYIVGLHYGYNFAIYSIYD